MARDDPKFMLRLPAAMKAQIEEAAHAAGRSINAEIVNRLERVALLEKIETVQAEKDEVSRVMTFSLVEALRRMLLLALTPAHNWTKDDDEFVTGWAEQIGEVARRASVDPETIARRVAQAMAQRKP